MPVEEFRELAAEITPHDNDSQLEMMTPHYLAMPGVLAGLGVSDSTEEVTFTLRLEDGSSETIAVPAMERDSVSRLVSIRDRLRADGVDLPVSRRTNGKLYRFEYLAGRGVVYVQYNSCREDESYPMGRFVADVFDTVGRRDAETLIVDLRRNSGGSSPVFGPFIDEAAAWIGGADAPGAAENPSAETPDARELYVLIGRDTFSSAVLNAIDLRQEAGAVFVGEPSGGRPNHYGEIKSLELPDLGRRLTYSTKYFTHYEEGDPAALMPDIEAPVSFEAYVDGRDPALEAVLEATHAGAGAAGRVAPNG
jgi:C-terminal processing protease CtpA/Prc